MATQTADWTCGHCDVTATWMPGHDASSRPADWVELDGELLCLACRRRSAAEAALEDIPDANVSDRAKTRRRALVDFEIDRTPDRSNGEIARAIRCSPIAVMQGRKRLAAKT